MAALAATIALSARSPASAASPCDAFATPATLSEVVAQAAPGQTVCLGDGDYGTWTGTAKAITLAAAPDASPRMRIALGAASAGFTLLGMSGMGGTIGDGAHDIVIRDSAFSSPIAIEATNADVVLDHDSFDWDAVYSADGPNAKIFVWNSTGAPSGVTVEHSTIRNGDLDGVHIGGDAGVDVLGNVFADLCDVGTNHTDNVQFEGGSGHVAGNFIYAGPGCDTQGITSFDGGTVGLVIEDNVVDIRRPWGIELYSDRDSVVRHNTLRWYNKSDCGFNASCGQIDIDRKPDDPAGSGTQVHDNLTTGVGFANGSTGIQHDNASAQLARFVGPLDLYAGFRLAADSPVGRSAASDGLDLGARIPATVPSPTPAPTATATATPEVTATPTVTQSPEPAATPTVTRSPEPVATAAATPGPAPAATAPATPAATPQPPPSSSGLVAAYTFEQREGRRLADVSGAGNPGTLHAARLGAAGRHGAALTLSGRGDVTVSDAPSLDLTAAFTLEAWVRPARARPAVRTLIAKERPGGPAYALYADAGAGRVAARIRTGQSYAVAGPRLRPGRWSHVAATYDGARLRVYVNGVAVASRRAAGRIRTSAAPLRIGPGVKGRIDDVRIWDVALSPAAVRRHASG